MNQEHRRETNDHNKKKEEETTKSHIHHNTLFRVNRKVVHSVDRLLDRHWLFLERLVLGVVPTPITFSLDSFPG
jgi:hypothetical protein